MSDEMREYKNRICVFAAASAKVYGPMDSISNIIKGVLPKYELTVVCRKEFFRSHRKHVDSYIAIPDTLIRLFERFKRRKFQLLARAFVYVLIQLYVALKVVSCRCRVFLVINAEAFIPMLLARVAGIHVVLRLGSSSYEVYERLGNKFLAATLGISEKTLKIVAHKVVYAGPPKIFSRKLYSNTTLLPSKEFLEIFKCKSNAADRPLLVGYLGRLSPEKGVDILVPAIKLITSRDEDIKVVIAGDGPLRGLIERELEKEIKNGRVKLLGWLPHEKVPEFLSKIRLLLMPSYTEGLPSALIETMACGTPVLTTRVGEIPNVVIHGETGLLMDELTSNNIASLVLMMVKDEQRLRRMSTRCSTYMAQFFKEEEVIRVWEKILRPE
ncbi:MAG: glycosyltransferase family 4 protein [Candidatus Bathycorpusculaceae bacterium]